MYKEMEDKTNRVLAARGLHLEIAATHAGVSVTLFSVRSRLVSSARSDEDVEAVVRRLCATQCVDLQPVRVGRPKGRRDSTPRGPRIPGG
jgi:hypothetical protein